MSFIQCRYGSKHSATEFVLRVLNDDRREAYGGVRYHRLCVTRDAGADLVCAGTQSATAINWRFLFRLHIALIDQSTIR